MMGKNNTKLPKKHRNCRFPWKRLFTFPVKFWHKKKLVSQNEKKGSENPMKLGIQCTQDHDNDTVLIQLMKKISNAADIIYDDAESTLLQGLSKKTAGLMEVDPIHSRLTRNRIHHTVELSQKVYGVCTQDHEVDATYRRVTNNMNVFDYPLKNLVTDHCAGFKQGTDPLEKQADIALHGDNHSKRKLCRFNSCPLLEKITMEENSCASMGECNMIADFSCIPSLKNMNSVETADSIKSLHDVDKSVTNSDMDSFSLAKLNMQSSVEVADEFTNPYGSFTIDNSDTSHGGLFYKLNYKMQDLPTHDLKADETSSVKLTKMFDDIPEPIHRVVRKIIANGKIRNDIYKHFLKFENFSRITIKPAVQMMSASEFCHPRFAEEEQRKLTLQGLTELQMFRFERQELARTGWFYNHQVLTTFCCGMEMPISPSGSPLDVHYALSPHCLFAQSLQNKRQSELPTVHRRETENQIHLTSPVQCSEDNEAVSLSVEEYLAYSSLGLFHPALRESVPGEHWVMDSSYSSSAAAAARINSATDEHDSLVTNRTPLPSEEFQPFVSDTSQMRDGGRIRNTLQPSQSHERVGTDQARRAQASVGQLSMRAGGEDTLSMASVLQGLQQSAGNQNLQSVFVADQINMDGMRGDGYRARYPQFAFPTVRIWTYEGWPSNRKQTPSMLADAGFFYAGYGDCVLCYCCGIGVRFWKPADDPWVEHARLQQTCTFMQVMQGQYFIEAAVALSCDGGHTTYENVRIEANRRQRADETGENPSSPAPGAVGDTQMLCKVCFLRERSIVLMPCRHLAVCIQCSGRISSCPLCHEHIESTLQASF